MLQCTTRKLRLTTRTHVARVHNIGSNTKSRILIHPWIADLPTVTGLDPETRLLTFISGNCASGNVTNIIRDWCYLNERTEPSARKIVFQTIASAGLPKVLNTFSTLAERFESETPEKTEQLSGNYKWLYHHQTGEEFAKLALQNKYDNFRQKLAEHHPVLDKITIEGCFGALLNPAGLTGTLPPPNISQLCHLSASVGTVKFRPFRSFIHSALNTGCSLDEIRGVLDETQLVWGSHAQILVDALWADINKRDLISGHKDGNAAPSSVPPSPASPTPTDQVHHKKYHFTLDFTPIKPRHPLLEAFRHVPALSDSTRILTLIAAHTMSTNLTALAQDWSYLPRDMHVQGIEVLLQCVLFAGYQTVVSAFDMLSGGISEEAVKKTSSEDSPDKFRQQGENALKEIYRKQADRLRERLHSFYPDLEPFVVEFAYGRILSRSGLSLKDRELCTIACLSGELVFPQLHSHLLGALNVGATLEEIRGVLDQAEVVWGSSQQAVIDGYWLDFLSRLK